MREEDKWAENPIPLSDNIFRWHDIKDEEIYNLMEKI